MLYGQAPTRSRFACKHAGLEDINMLLNKIPFESGSLETMIERLLKTMNAIDKQWSETLEPASQQQIHDLERISGVNQNGKSIPFAYLLFLEEMGNNDNGLLEQEYDGDTEVNIDSVLNGYHRYIDDFDINEYILISTHWTDCTLFLKPTNEENPSIYDFRGKLFSSSFENYLFQMAFRTVEHTQFLYCIELATSEAEFREILIQKPVQGIQWTTTMELIEYLLKPYKLQKMWFSDEVNFCGVSSEYIIRVTLRWGLNIRVSSNNFNILQKIKRNLIQLFGDFIHECRT